MGVRLDWVHASAASPDLVRKGATLGDGQTVTEPFAFLVGTQVVEGTFDDLKLLVAVLHEKLAYVA